MKANNRYIIHMLAWTLYWVVTSSCGNDSEPTDQAFQYERTDPKYDLVQLIPGTDTLHLTLDSDTYNSIRSFNVFVQNNVDFISFYDPRSESINFYNINTRLLQKKIKLNKYLSTSQRYKISTYTRSFDSIFISNATALYLMDTSGKIKKSIDLIEKEKFVRTELENYTPIIIKDKTVYAATHANIDETSFADLRKWRVVYTFDLKNKKAALKFRLPEIYLKNIYGDHFLEYSFCNNNRNNMVFSFWADPNLYETNLVDLRKAYSAKSQFHTSDILPVDKKALLNDEGYKQYRIRDSYGPVFFDPVRKRYLRLFKRKMSEVDYVAKNVPRKENLIIFNENFQIIGESEMPAGMDPDLLFFTSNGQMYARTKTDDEYSLHFVRIDYREEINNKRIAGK